MGRPEQMLIGWMLNPVGTHPAGWTCFPDGPDPCTDIHFLAEQARIAEAGCLDFLFQVDSPAMRPGSIDSIARNPTYANQLEPLTQMAALAMVTSKIGLVATASTSFMDPYNLARQFASLDHISGGRAGWNIVTTRATMAAYNFGHLAEVPHAERYRRAHEYVEVVKGLWNSFEEGAFVRDPESGYYFDPAKLHVLNHSGNYFKVRGPLTIDRPPQGQPVLFQAGASDDGMDLGARFGEVIFCIHTALESCRDYRTRIRARAAAIGRDPSELRVCNAINLVIGETRQQADDAFGEMQDRMHPDTIKHIVSVDLETDVMDLGIDDLVGVERLPASANSSKSADKLIRSWLAEQPMTVRQLYNKFSTARGAVTVHGSPREIADTMEEWFMNEATDGFILMLPLPSGLTDFSRKVVPELQRRGLFKTSYSASTMRENFGLGRPSGIAQPAQSLVS